MKCGKELKEMNQGELIQCATEIEEELMGMFEEEFSQGQIIYAFKLMRDFYKCGFRCGLLCNEPYQPAKEQ